MIFSRRRSDVTDRPRLTRRAAIGSIGALIAAPMLPVHARGAAGEQPITLYIGSYTPNGAGIYTYRMNAQTGTLTCVSTVGDVKNPSWLALHPAKSFLYAVNEIDRYLGEKGGSITAYAIDAASGALTELNAISSKGATPTHLSVHPSGRFVFAANYGGGSVAVLPIGDDGRLAEASHVVAGFGTLHGAKTADNPPGNFAPSDHTGSHIHMVASDPSGRFVVANDAGLDRTYVWRIDLSRGRLLPATYPVVDAAPGSAPRHFAFHPNGRVFYNLTEQDCMIAVYRFAVGSGKLSLVQRLSTLPTAFAGSNLASEIGVSGDGRFVYAGNRLRDTIARFSIGPDGRLFPLGETWVQADYPRSFAIDPTGQFLYSCNQRSDSITSFARDVQTGELTFTGRYEAIGSPVSIIFVQPEATDGIM